MRIKVIGSLSFFSTLQQGRLTATTPDDIMIYDTFYSTSSLKMRLDFKHFLFT